jgi:hypothetical protein
MPAAIPTALLAKSLVSFSCPRDASSPPHHSLNRLFFSLAGDVPAVIPTVPLTKSLISFSCRRHAHRHSLYAASGIARFLVLLMIFLLCHSLHCEFLLLEEVLPTALLAELLHSFSC